MIHFDRVAEPPEFDAQARQPGLQWLESHTDAVRPRDYWSDFKGQLADGFRQLCGYSAMFEPVGTIDHYISWHNDRSRACEWDNYRFVSQWINSSKQTVDGAVFDPYDVQDGWFEIILPSVQLRVTDRVPEQIRELAEYTLVRLNLRDDERIIRQRQAWYEKYLEGKINLAGLHDFAPLIARAVERQNAQQ